jgi:dTDP-4-dehydrorhamnose 3,5-epimerase
VRIRELDIPDAYEFSPEVHRDDRGEFAEFYRFDRLEETVGHALTLKQGNLSVSSRGVVRGVHYALVPPSQAKFVHAPHGAFLDVVVDIRVGSPTFGRWDSVVIDDVDRRGVYVAEGLGHVLIALTDGATASYLTSAVFDPEREKGISPLDPELGIDFPLPVDELVLSPKDLAAPTLAEAASLGLLPTWDETRAYYRSLETVR